MAPARIALVGFLLFCAASASASAASARDLLDDASAVSGEEIVPIMPTMNMLVGAVAAMLCYAAP